MMEKMIEYIDDNLNLGIIDAFPLSDIQELYWLGCHKQSSFGNVSAHTYFEIDIQQLDLVKYNQAWQRLIKYHPMLRAIVLHSGQQKILEQVPDYTIEIQNLLDAQLTTAKAKILINTRMQMLHTTHSTEAWPLFQIKATLIDKMTTRIHIRIDTLITDKQSITLLFKQLAQLYFDPTYALPKLNFCYSDYVGQNKLSKNNELYLTSRKYWFTKLNSLPFGPELPIQKKSEAYTKPRFKTLRQILPEKVWMPLKEKIAQLNLTSTNFLLSVFAKILATWSQNTHFTIPVITTDRLPLHSQIHDVVGNFTSFILLAIDANPAISFIAFAEAVQKQLTEDLKHSWINGVEVLHEFARLHKISSTEMFSILFSSSLELDSSHCKRFSETNLLGQCIYEARQTPTVWL